MFSLSLFFIFPQSELDDSQAKLTDFKKKTIAKLRQADGESDLPGQFIDQNLRLQLTDILIILTLFFQEKSMTKPMAAVVSELSVFCF